MDYAKSIEVRAIARLFDINSVLGIDARKAIVCPLPQHVHHNNTPSFAVTLFRDGRQRFHCFGNCGLKGDVIDLIGYMLVPGYDPRSGAKVREAADLLISKHQISPPPPMPKAARLDPLKWKELLPPSEKVVKYAISRGLTRETVKKFKIGGQRAMAIPIFADGNLVGIKYRGFGRLRYWSEKGSVTTIYNLDAIRYTERPVLVLKGEIPVMLLDQCGILACAPTGGEGQWELSGYRPDFAFCKRVVVVGDNDRNPKTREKMQSLIAKRAETIGGEVRFPPEKYKDIDEWILDDPLAIPNILLWLGE